MFLKLFLPFGAIALGVLLLSPVVIEASREKCPCLTFGEKDDIDEFEEEFLNYNSTTMQGVDFRTYGVGCGAHDANISFFCETNEEWCDYQWCYVDAENCELEHSPSLTYPFLMYSFATCGYTDDYQRDPSSHLKEGIVLQGVYIDNHRGYEGTECANPNILNDHTTCSGTVVELMNDFFYLNNQYNITLNITSVPEDITKRAESYGPFLKNNENMEHGACVYATSLGVVDLCIGAFTKNLQRTGISSFLEMGVTSEYLVVQYAPVVNDLSNMNKTIRNIFAPFSLTLWIVTFAVLFLLSLLFLVQEYSWSELRATRIENSAGLAAYNAALSFFSQERITERDPSSWGGRFTLLAIAVQVLLTGASYTANLTNFLVRGSSSLAVESMHDVITKELEVCVLRNKISILESNFGDGAIKYAIDPDTEEEGFKDRTELLLAMDEGRCSCAVVGLAELDTYHGNGKHCDKKFVGTPVIELPWGIPISDKYAAPMNTVITEFLESGDWARVQKTAKPETKCGGDQEFSSEETSLTPLHMLGAYMLSFALATVGIILSLVKINNNRTRWHVSQSAEPTSKFDLGMMEVDDEEIPTTPSGIDKYEDLNTAMTSLKTEIADQIADLKQIILSEQNKKISAPHPIELYETIIFSNDRD